MHMYAYIHNENTKTNLLLSSPNCFFNSVKMWFFLESTIVIFSLILDFSSSHALRVCSYGQRKKRNASNPDIYIHGNVSVCIGICTVWCNTQYVLARRVAFPSFLLITLVHLIFDFPTWTPGPSKLFDVCRTNARCYSVRNDDHNVDGEKVIVIIIMMVNDTHLLCL